ncbi:MAG: hypothetical protein HZT40_08875 [Candidatus Thiothrix singaporensis]|uniref:Uncharacterized protein n=1 Tax=Candidatus Thiothrix singaporensis TaxID=2799669 RepID=A0A7L6ARI4_9GAMM|nr:MAG: hypothetical protein HZT40_08875 [Candidatus Thiothrix singaporensis]
MAQQPYGYLERRFEQPTEPFNRFVSNQVSGAILLLAAALTAGAFTLLLLALYQSLITYWPPTLAYLAMGLVCLLLAGSVLWIAMQTQRQA